MTQHERLTINIKVQVYFCDPKSPWQRDTNENTNRLLREYFPKGTDLSHYSQADLNTIALRLRINVPGRPWGFRPRQLFWRQLLQSPPEPTAAYFAKETL